MVRHEEARKPLSFTDRRPRVAADDPWTPSEPRTIVIRHGSGWQSLAVLFLCLLLAVAVLLGHWVVRELDRKDQEATATMARAERKIQQLESGFTFEARRRQLLLGMRNHILKTNRRVSLADAYRYAELALAASEKYPAVDPLLLLAIGIVESGYDPQARSRADARGLYQIWPSTGRLLARALGWSYDDTTLYDPEKNTEAAALYLDVLFSTYKDPQLVLAEYNGGPLNAGYLRAGAAALASETRSYVPRVLELHARLQQEFETGTALALQTGATDDSGRRGKALGAP
jgi:soluble lytic murein transglycosylase-like protein